MLRIDPEPYRFVFADFQSSQACLTISLLSEVSSSGPLIVMCIKLNIMSLPSLLRSLVLILLRAVATCSGHAFVTGADRIISATKLSSS